MESMKYEEIEFLKQSNNIEGVFDDDSLAQAIYAWQYLRKQKELTEQVIKKTHKILMLHSKLLPNEKGYYRLSQVGVNTKHGFIEKMRWEKINVEMESWCSAVNTWLTGCISTNSFSETIERELHVMYENIHPFIDGNGRTGRMFLNWIRYRIKMPLLIIKATERQNYYEWFK